ncbi:MAG: hypothetical protein A3F70_12565 [Acidobacteria bacterium RIFCSPLOWO2_12_FULL_67_14]|nr:MAG: hypothetical protein A3F70_12565 [Acidobacteria bacterium RIFCSPLOWO2_12_FULL_67_14]
MNTTLATSVIIPTRNRPQLLADTVASLLRGDTLPAEIVVVDQSDHMVARTEHERGCCIRYVPCADRGLSRARNTGANLARHEALVFVDDDMTADPQWLRALVDALLAAGEDDAVTGRVLAGPQEVADGFVPALARRTVPAVFRGRSSRDVLAGGNMGIRRAALNRVGGFDVRLGAGSRFPSAEDNDLGFRLLEAGARVVFVPEALLYHRAWRSKRLYVPLRHAYGRGKGGFYAKHLKLRDGYMWHRMVRDLIARPGRAVRHAGHPREALGELAYAAGVLRGAVAWLFGGRARTEARSSLTQERRRPPVKTPQQPVGGHVPAQRRRHQAEAGR